MGIGTIVGQGINFLSQPIITRLITPEDLGIYTFIITMANLVIPVASLKLYMLIVVEGEDQAANELTFTSLMTVTLISILYSVVIILSYLIGNNTFSDTGIIVFTIPLIVFFNGIRFVLISYNNRFKKYSLIAKNEVYRELAKGIIQITSALLGGRALGQTLGYALAPLAGFKNLYKEYHMKRNKYNFNLKNLLKKYYTYRNHILYLVPAQFVNTFSYALITMSVASLYTAKEVGYYAISVNVLGLPLVIITNNISKVFLQVFSDEKKSSKSLWKSYLKIINLLLIVSVIVFGLLAITAPLFTEIIFGKGYDQSGVYIACLSIMYGFRFITSSISGSYVILNKQRNDTFFQILLVIFGGIVYLVSLYFSLSIYMYLLFISLSYSLVYILMIVNIGINFKTTEFEVN